jgi:hypothetical protein
LVRRQLLVEQLLALVDDIAPTDCRWRRNTGIPRIGGGRQSVVCADSRSCHCRPQPRRCVNPLA